ncbi:MAG: DUF4140 domain-containing protein, partial [Desulfobacterales bacterium]|nr:DUF4140 domain-containing protein [Desulfobacterales bacterium]
MGTTKNEPVFIPSDPENHVSDVIVFSNNAYVTRRAKVDIEQGVQKIRIETTAFRIAKDSPQAEVLGHGSILGVQYKEVPVLIPPQPGLESLEAEKKALEREKSLLMKQMETIDRQKSFLDAFISFSDTQVPKEIQTRFPGPSDVENMVETLGTSYTSLFKKEKALLESLEDMNDKLSLVNRKIGARQQPSPKKRKVIEVIFDSEKDQQIDCRVSYITRNAGWTP